MEELLLLIEKSYGSADDKFALSLLDKERALKSLVVANTLGVGFGEFIQLHQNYLENQHQTNEHILSQIERVKTLNNYFKND